jgi:hypothetical protein
LVENERKWLQTVEEMNRKKRYLRCNRGYSGKKGEKGEKRLKKVINLTSPGKMDATK